MADLPSVLFISCSDVDSDDIIKLILNESELAKKVEIDKDIYSFPWHIDNKYYTAEVRLCSLKKKSLCNRKFCESVEAVVVYFDSSKKHSLEEVETWLSYINEFAPEIKILLCKNIKSEDENSAGITKLFAQQWCIKRQFELVELEPLTEDQNNDLENDFQETTGVKRIIQALYAHVWPNLVMKSQQKLTPLIKSVSQSQAVRKQLHFEESLEELLENDDDFSQLFCQLSEMKARVSSLSGSERKTAAEQVVKAFWKALNGNEEDL